MCLCVFGFFKKRVTETCKETAADCLTWALAIFGHLQLASEQMLAKFGLLLGIYIRPCHPPVSLDFDNTYLLKCVQKCVTEKNSIGIPVL